MSSQLTRSLTSVSRILGAEATNANLAALFRLHRNAKNTKTFSISQANTCTTLTAVGITAGVLYYVASGRGSSSSGKDDSLEGPSKGSKTDRLERSDSVDRVQNAALKIMPVKLDFATEVGGRSTFNSQYVDDKSVEIKVLGSSILNTTKPLGEGNMHMAFSLDESDNVIRLRKSDPAQMLYDLLFRKRVIRALFSECECELQIPELVLLEKGVAEKMGSQSSGSVANKFSGTYSREECCSVDKGIQAMLDHSSAATSVRDNLSTGTTVKLSTLCPETTLKISGRKKFATEYVFGGVLPNALTCDGLKGKNGEVIPKENILTVEIKPKCGLLESATLPSRFQMLQYEKLEKGEITERSKYDPLELFSRRLSTVSRAVKNLIDTPQNNLKMYKGGQEVVNANDMIVGSASSNSSQIEGEDQLIDLVSRVVFSDSIFRTILKVQCWAAGRTAIYAGEIYDKMKSTGQNTDFSIAETLRAATSRLRTWTDDESGMRWAEREGERLAERVERDLKTALHSTSRDDMAIQLQDYLCRFLLGRMAMDLSVCINLVEVNGALDEKSTIFQKGFKPIPSYKVNEWRSMPTLDRGANLASGNQKPDAGATTGAVSEANASNSSSQWYYRIVLLDTDSKPSKRIPQYKNQLNEYAEAYKRGRNRS